LEAFVLSVAGGVLLPRLALVGVTFEIHRTPTIPILHQWWGW
jgi:hypothetical protein